MERKTLRQVNIVISDQILYRFQNDTIESLADILSVFEEIKEWFTDSRDDVWYSITELSLKKFTSNELIKIINEYDAIWYKNLSEEQQSWYKDIIIWVLKQ